MIVLVMIGAELLGQRKPEQKPCWGLGFTIGP